MDANAVLTPTSFVPSIAQVALAIAVVRLNTTGCSAREYVLSLRDQVKAENALMAGQATRRYLDLVAYWQEQYKRMQQERDHLQIINTKLERSNQLLTTRMDAMAESNVQQRNLKPRLEPIAEHADASAQSTTENDYIFLDTLGADGTQLMSTLFTIHKLCAAVQMDADSLCLNLVSTSSTLGRVIHFVAQKYSRLSHDRQTTPKSTALKSDKSDLTSTLSVCVRIFMSVLVGIRKLVETQTNEQLIGKIVYELAEMFKSVLNSIESSAKETARMQALEHAQSKKGRGKKSGNALLIVPAYEISHLLLNFIGFLDKLDTTHQKIFDAFLFVLFERVGRRLNYCVFGRGGNGSIQDRILSTRSLQDVSNDVEHDAETRAIKLEVKALVLILERAMGLAPNHMNPHVSKEPARLGCSLTSKNFSVASRARLSPLAKNRLQRTLIASMYGATSDPNDDFLDILTKPVPSMHRFSTQNIIKSQEEDIESWYMKEVWRLVGWDILARENGW